LLGSKHLIKTINLKTREIIFTSFFMIKKRGTSNFEATLICYSSIDALIVLIPKLTLSIAAYFVEYKTAPINVNISVIAIKHHGQIHGQIHLNT